MKTREALIQEIHQKAPAIAALLGEASDQQVAEAAKVLGISLEGGAFVPVAEAVEAAATVAVSLDDRSRAVRRAVRETYGKGLNSECVWAEVVFDDHVIVRKGDKLYSVGYTLAGADNTVTFNGDPVEVRVAYVPTAEAVDLEAAKSVGANVAQDGWLIGPVAEGEQEFTGAAWDIIIIEEGLSKNRNLYRKPVLESALPLYNGKPIYADHPEAPRRFGRSTQDAIGFIKDPRGVSVAHEATGESHYAVGGRACIVDPAWQAKMLNAWKMGNPGLFGFSHFANTEHAVTRVGTVEARDMQKITGVVSVDLVMNPSAGGRIASVLESTQEKDDMRDKLLAKLKDMGRTDVIESLGQTPTDQQVMEAYEKAVADAAKPAAPAVPAGAAAPATTAAPAAEAVDAKKGDVSTALLKRLLRADVREAIDGAQGLPKKARDMMMARFNARIESGTLQFEGGMTEVTEAIREQVEIAASVVEEAGIEMPMRHFSVTKSSRDQATEALDDFFAQKHGAMQSFKDIYVMVTGDRNVTGRAAECVRLREFGTRESIDTSVLTNLMQNSLTKAMLPYYNLPEFADWRILANVVPLKDFRQQQRVRYGGYGNLSIVGQGQPFPLLTSPTDEQATYSPSKRGGTEDITIEAIRNDDVGLIRDIPRRLGRAAAQTLHEFVFDMLANNATIYDSTALATSGHGNIITTALTPSNVQVMWQKLKKQTDMSNGKRLGLSLRHIFVPTDLAELAYQIVEADRAVPDSNVASTAAAAAPNFTNKVVRPAVHTVDYWTDANNYWGAADKSQLPMMEVGFTDGEEPQLLLQDDPTTGSVFSHEKHTWKIRHVYGGAITDYRGFVGAIVP